jgi:GT2 family glycosyltransferase
LKVEDVTIENNNIYIPSGAFFIVKSDVLDKIGGFPIDNFLYFEEWLFADRVNKFNLMGYVDIDLKVHHQIGYSTGLQYGAGSEKMLKYRKDAFLKSISQIEKNSFLKALEYSIILLDYAIRIFIVKLKRLRHDYM